MFLSSTTNRPLDLEGASLQRSPPLFSTPNPQVWILLSTGWGEVGVEAPEPLEPSRWFPEYLLGLGLCWH